jgi:Tol biopolymer transport system component
MLFVRQSRLLVQPFALENLSLTGEPVMVAASIGRAGNRAFFAVSPSGTLAYSSGTNYQLMWIDRAGRRAEPVVEAVESTYARISPNESQIVFDRIDEEGGVDIWLTEIARGVMTRLSLDRARDEFPIWSPDGSRVIFRSDRTGVFDLYEKSADGTGGERLVLHTDHEKWPGDWSHDGRYVIYEERTTQDDFWLLPVAGNRSPVALTRTQFSENHAQFSPDDHWIAYQSNQSGRWEVYIQPFVPSSAGGPALGAVYQVSRDGGQRPVWRADGKELVYVAGDGSVVAVDVSATPQLQVGTAKRLFQSPMRNFPRLQMSRDGTRFLVNGAVAEGGSGAITIVLNWQAALRP